MCRFLCVEYAAVGSLITVYEASGSRDGGRLKLTAGSFHVLLFPLKGRDGPSVSTYSTLA